MHVFKVNLRGEYPSRGTGQTCQMRTGMQNHCCKVKLQSAYSSAVELQSKLGTFAAAGAAKNSRCVSDVQRLLETFCTMDVGVFLMFNGCKKPSAEWVFETGSGPRLQQ